MKIFLKLSFRNFTSFFFSFVLLVIGIFVCSFPAYAAGELDVTFGTGGLVSTDFGGPSDFGQAVTIDSSGRIVVVGQASSIDPFQQSFGLARYDQQGNLDPSFGSGGLVSTDFGGHYVQFDVQFDGTDRGRSVAIDSAGQILVAGTCTNSDANFGLARYDENGNLDTSFGDNGLVSADFGSSQGFGWSVAIDSDDRQIVGGYCQSASGEYYIALVCYDEDGDLDPSFGSGGIVSTDFGKTSNKCRSFVLDSEGQILAVGCIYNSDFDFALVRYDKNGNLDMSFGNGGIVSVDFGGCDEAWSVIIDKENRILIAGGSSNDSGFCVALARYDENGNLDPSFGTGGLVSTDFGGSAGYSMPQREFSSRAVVDNYGRIVVSTTVFNGNTNDFALARFDQDGNIDPSFGNDGIVSTDFGGQTDYGRSCVIDGSGRILVTGYTENSIGEIDFALARYVESFTITALSCDYGGITPESADVVYSDDVTFTISPEEYYHLDHLYVDGNLVSPDEGEAVTYTFHNVSANHVISADFRLSADDDMTGGNLDGCNISALSGMGLLLVLPLMFLSGKMK